MKKKKAIQLILIIPILLYFYIEIKSFISNKQISHSKINQTYTLPCVKRLEYPILSKLSLANPAVWGMNGTFPKTKLSLYTNERESCSIVTKKGKTCIICGREELCFTAISLLPKKLVAIVDNTGKISFLKEGDTIMQGIKIIRIHPETVKILLKGNPINVKIFNIGVSQ